MNKVTLVGRLTRDPEIRYSGNGTAIVSSCVAVDDKYKKGDEWIDQAQFIEFVIFGKRGEAFAKYHKKGNGCILDGALRLDQWEKDGKKRSRLAVKIDSWEFVPRSANKQNEEQHAAEQQASPEGELYNFAPGQTDDTPF